MNARSSKPLFSPGELTANILALALIGSAMWLAVIDEYSYTDMWLSTIAGVLLRIEWAIESRKAAS